MIEEKVGQINHKQLVGRCQSLITTPLIHYHRSLPTDENMEGHRSRDV